ncbi:MAG: hypothetical protein LUC06_06795, partial [Oscillospiraceae bacterium]|nr:hypothetical protein [Oscillospiraceae bacterium]
SDQERFYNYLSFYSYEDLQIQMKRYLRRSNRIPMFVLGWKTPGFADLGRASPSPRQQNRCSNE